MRAVVAIIFLPILAFGQQTQTSVLSNNSKLETFVALYSQSDGEPAPSFENLYDFVEKLHDKKASFKTERAFLRFVFAKSHQRYLKHYVQYASFRETLTNGRYNCLTGTAFYALLLDHFGIAYRIVETNYHIFLLIHVDGQEVLLEATDPVKGLADNKKTIEERISSYKQNTIAHTNPEKSYYHFNFELYNEVNLTELLGLFHYNHAIVAFNKQALELAVHHLEHAILRYQSPRIGEFSKILLLAILESDMEISKKENYIRKVYILRQNPAYAQR